jgi:hypothetical protein
VKVSGSRKLKIASNTTSIRGSFFVLSTCGSGMYEDEAVLKVRVLNRA